MSKIKDVDQGYVRRRRKVEAFDASKPPADMKAPEPVAETPKPAAPSRPKSRPRK